MPNLADTSLLCVRAGLVTRDLLVPEHQAGVWGSEGVEAVTKPEHRAEVHLALSLGLRHIAEVRLVLSHRKFNTNTRLSVTENEV